MFVKTKEYKEFEQQLKQSINIIKANGFKCLIALSLIYFILSSLLILLPQ